LGNTNLLRAVSGELSREDPVGTVRETFVQHQLISAGLQVRIPDKGKHQITGKENAYVIKDDIEIGYGNVMPMWLFGFLY
jgi:hypothetical protein